MLHQFELNLLRSVIAKQDSVEVMELLEHINKGNTLNKLMGRTFLHSIAMMGEIDIYDQLVSLNIETDIPDHQGETPSQLIQRWKSPQLPLGAYLTTFTGEDRIPISSSPFVYGREKESVSYHDPANHISARHMQIEHVDGAYYICDLGSLNGTFLNGRKLENNKQERLKEDDHIRVHNTQYLFKYSDSLPLSVYLIAVDEMGPSTKQRIKINKFPFEYGRDAEKVSYVVLSPHISRRHMSIQSRFGQYFISDLGSSNGTYVNGKRLLEQEEFQLKHGDLIKIYQYSYLFSVK
ncbi:FHA domain-containing protein [Paenibacillus sp. FSL H7-0331]|uniref:FHA domain-containing protein n=1 Tax=Paenibacillus sp. FSL H7-0331 TaxID=1920421 RepID=UPI00096FC1D1|nr:FHA domain-containing protein [Paenibacillus sp. FSL H7-0331]OMF02877.1 hypothetical protein BK127_36560 [Paenibacillus sp. FSL H7-0331]